ncbi:MAG TPA: amidase [Candidatus Elarobacter sp.]|nr:amidase [Candidatus Elarobacter sp.]
MLEQTSVVERAQALLARIDAENPRINAYVALDRDAVLRDAARLDAVPPAQRGPVHGVTVAVKDIIDVAGLPTRAGSSFFRRDPERDAPVVAMLRAAGALITGKTNTHEFAWGITTENPHFGRTVNPWSSDGHDRTAGGSSGGSGAAVAAGLADVALGTDTLGSIRIPSALNGVSGLRPATGALPIDGIFPLAIGLDTVGPFARDLATVQRVYEVLAGAVVASTPRACRLRSERWDRVDPAVASALDAAAAALRDAGVVVDDVAWWDEDLVGAVAIVQQRAAARVHEPIFATNEHAYGNDVRARVATALRVGEDDEHAARATIERARATWARATAGYDVALAPVVPSEAPMMPAPPDFRANVIPLVTPGSAFGLPVAAVPIGFGPAGMPLGMQLIATSGVAAAFALGNRFQRLTDWHRRTPLQG